jgi:hypothetical protein
MKADELMKADVVSELILAVSGLVLFVPLVLLLVDILHAALSGF